ncbi:hypothetical protein C4K08_1947 [Pseudomonas chlororaphis subsp. aureofaciens]|nr:hypothetical protein C4K08_1947 [Pseudomonas chlororaphis subsp. aureofaciens]
MLTSLVQGFNPIAGFSHHLKLFRFEQHFHRCTDKWMVINHQRFEHMNLFQKDEEHTICYSQQVQE